MHRRWGGNVDPLPFAYAFRPRLRGRLTLGGLTFPRKPQAYGEVGFHHLYRYSCRQSHFPAVHHRSRGDFNPLGTLPYRAHGPKSADTRRFGTGLEPRYIFGAEPLDQ